LAPGRRAEVKKTPGVTSLRLSLEAQGLLKRLGAELGVGRADVVAMALRLLCETLRETGAAGAEALRRLAENTGDKR
jgi:hypothetical protein